MKAAILALAVLSLYSYAKADSNTSTVTFNEVIAPANFSAPGWNGYFVSEGLCLLDAEGSDYGLTFYSTITVTLPSSVAYSGQFGWTPVMWSVEDFPADLALFLDQWNNLPGVVISDASVTETTCPPNVPEPSIFLMLLSGLALVGALWGRL